jgi:hypothetical protein
MNKFNEIYKLFVADQVQLNEAKTKTSPKEKLEIIKRIVADHAYEKIDGTIIDATTANIILTVHDALGKANRVKFLGEPIERMADLAFKLTKR